MKEAATRFEKRGGICGQCKVHIRMRITRRDTLAHVRTHWAIASVQNGRMSSGGAPIVATCAVVLLLVFLMLCAWDLLIGCVCFFGFVCLMPAACFL